MPYYRRNYRRSYNRRPYRPKRVYRAKWSRKNPRQGMGDGKRFFKLRATVPLVSDAGGAIADVLTNNPSATQDWPNISALFDSYKVCAIKVKFIPDKPNDTSTITSYKPFYMVHDPDDYGVPTSSNQMIQYENVKIYNLYRPFSYYRRLSRQTSVGLGTVVLQGGYRDAGDVTATQSIKYYADGLDVSDNYGTFIVTLYVSAKNRR